MHGVVNDSLEKKLIFQQRLCVLTHFSGMFFASTMIMVSIALVMAVIVTNIYAKKDVPQRCPEWTVRLASRFYPAHFLPGHCVDAGTHYDRHGRAYTLPPIIERRGTQPSSARPDVSQLSSPHLGVAEKAAADNDEICAGRPICCGCCLHRKDLSKYDDRASRFVPPSRTSSSSCGRQVPTTLETFDFRRSEAEWRMVAKFTDRVFFWLFLVMSFGVQANLFLQMIPETRHAVVWFRPHRAYRMKTSVWPWTYLTMFYLRKY